MNNTGIYRLKQYRHENEAWERLLNFLKQENAFLKIRLSELLDNSSDKKTLAFAEHFQNLFILKDEFIDKALTDVDEQEKKIRGNVAVLKDQEKLRNEIQHLEKLFSDLKKEFNEYLFFNK
ncbi:MAG TPA: hypothetical protein VK718_12520 [Ferruginibacter sp.]|nr:hypothetical protein [Ferruginibacter sp.]